MHTKLKCTQAMEIRPVYAFIFVRCLLQVHALANSLIYKLLGLGASLHPQLLSFIFSDLTRYTEVCAICSDAGGKSYRGICSEL